MTPHDVQIQCAECGGMYMISHADATFWASVSGFSLNECDGCREKRQARQAVEAKKREQADARQLAAFKRWLKKHGMSEKQFAEFLETKVPREYLDEEDD